MILKKRSIFIYQNNTAMKKIFYLIICSVFASTLSFAQNVRFIQPDDAKKDWKLVKPKQLYILNGTELTDSLALVKVDANDLEKLEILNEVDGERLYGKKGANGVVLATTKANKTMTINPPAIALAKTSPLFILDNIELPGSDLGKVKPEDIESIEVLKEKKALEPYGEKGKNGVVIITTKSFAKNKVFQKLRSQKE
jgi:TonB-dependent SusC/RagA subfamily outer membrane receptor